MIDARGEFVRNPVVEADKEMTSLILVQCVVVKRWPLLRCSSLLLNFFLLKVQWTLKAGEWDKSTELLSRSSNV